mgnify:CR=1 FL=1
MGGFTCEMGEGDKVLDSAGEMYKKKQSRKGLEMGRW